LDSELQSKEQENRDLQKQCDEAQSKIEDIEDKLA
jgi:hypothetical protein